MAGRVECKGVARGRRVITDDACGRRFIHVGHIDRDRLDDAVARPAVGPDVELVAGVRLVVELRALFQRDRVPSIANSGWPPTIS